MELAYKKSWISDNVIDEIFTLCLAAGLFTHFEASRYMISVKIGRKTYYYYPSGDLHLLGNVEIYTDDRQFIKAIKECGFLMNLLDY